MSEENVNGATAPAEAATGPAFTVEKIYVKDVSFEVPGAPASAFGSVPTADERSGVHGCGAPPPAGREGAR